jgi:hypothetical protein
MLQKWIGSIRMEVKNFEHESHLRSKGLGSVIILNFKKLKSIKKPKTENASNLLNLLNALNLSNLLFSSTKKPSLEKDGLLLN